LTISNDFSNTTLNLLVGFFSIDDPNMSLLITSYHNFDFK